MTQLVERGLKTKHRTRPCDLLLGLFLKRESGIIENYFVKDVFRGVREQKFVVFYEMSRADLKEVRIFRRSVLQLKKQQVQRTRDRNVTGMFEKQQGGHCG